MGAHDFSSFRHSECAAQSPHRTVYRAALEEDGPALDLVFEGNRFLMHMVRIMAGTLVEVGKGRCRAEDLAAILAARDRRRAGHHRAAPRPVPGAGLVPAALGHRRTFPLAGGQRRY